MDKNKAQKAAESLARRCGEGYLPVIHENLGWHYMARKGFIRVYEYIQNDPERDGYPASYSARIEPDMAVGFYGGTMSLAVQVSAKGETPKEAIENALKARDEDCNKMTQIISKLLSVK